MIPAARARATGTLFPPEQSENRSLGKKLDACQSSLTRRARAGEVQNISDLAIAFAVRDPSEHLGLAQGERMERGERDGKLDTFGQAAPGRASSGVHR